jgi:hypothetical protein
VSTATTRRVTAAFQSGPMAVRSFRLLAGGQLASTIGDYCYAVALPWLVLSNHGSTVLLGIVLACYGVPRTVLIPVGGMLADKSGARNLMLAADIMRCLLVGVLTILAARHTVSLLALGPTAAFIGAGEGLFMPASYTIMPSLLDDTRLAAGNALSSTAIQVGSLVGPAIGGALVATTGGSTAAFGIDAASFAVSAATLALISRTPVAGSIVASAAAAAAESTAEAADSTTGQAKIGPDSPVTAPDSPAAQPSVKPLGTLAYLRQSRAIQVIMAVAIAANLASGGMGSVALPALAHAHWGASGYGALLTSMAAGAVIGTLAAARSGRILNPAMTTSIAFIIEAGAITAIPYLGEAGAAVALLILGICTGLGNVLFFTMAQRSIPSALLGRVLSMIMLCTAGVFPLSVAVTGILVNHVGATPFFPIAGGFLVVAIIGGNTQRAFRDFGRPKHLQEASQPA